MVFFLVDGNPTLPLPGGVFREDFFSSNRRGENKKPENGPAGF